MFWINAPCVAIRLKLKMPSTMKPMCPTELYATMRFQSPLDSSCAIAIIEP